MQFTTYHNSPQNYAHLVESNFLNKDDHNHQIHKPPVKPGHTHIPGYGDISQSNGQFETNFNSKTSHDNFEYSKHLLDNFFDPVHNNELVHNSSFINNRSENPYRNGDAKHFFNYNPNMDNKNINVPYANNYGTIDPNNTWDPYLNPKNNLESYLSQQIVKNIDHKHLIESQRSNLNSFYPKDINPYNNFLKDFNPSDNFITGKNNFNMANGNDTPLNQLQSHVNANVPPDAPRNVDTGIPSNIPHPPDLMNQSLKDFANNLSQKSMDIINDTVRYIGNNQTDLNAFWSIFTRPDRIAYVGILIILFAIFWSIMS